MGLESLPAIAKTVAANALQAGAEPFAVSADGPVVRAASLLSLDGSVVVQLGLFLLLMFVLDRLLFRPVLEALALRERRTLGARTEAGQAHEEAEAKVAEFERRIRAARDEAFGERRVLRDEGGNLRTEILDAARDEARDLVEASRKELAAAAAAARVGVDAAATSLAGQIVARLLGRVAGVLLVGGIGLAAVAAATLAGEAQAWASDAPRSAGEFLKGVLFATLNFAVFAFLIVRFGRKGFAGFFAGRSAEVARELGEASRLHDEARAKLAEYSAKLDGLEAERRALVDRFVTDGQAEKERILAEARLLADRLRDEARRTIEREVRQVRLDIQAEVLDLAVRRAAERLVAEAGPDDQRRLADDFVAGLHAGPDDPRRPAADVVASPDNP